MAVIDIDQGRKFITTEQIGDSGEVGEQKVWDATKSAFVERSCIGYWRYPIFSKVGERRKEPDILIADIQAVYAKRFKVEVAQSMVSRAMKKLKFRRKKKSEYALEQDRNDVKKNGKNGEEE